MFRRVAAFLAITTLFATAVGSSTPAQAAGLFLPDPALKSCINWNIHFDRPRNQDVTMAEALRLTELECSGLSKGTGIVNAEGIQHFTNLTYLSISKNSLQTTPDLSTLTKLTVLDLSHNYLKSLPSVNTLMNLKALYLEDNALSSPPSITGLANLSILWLHRNSLTTAPDLNGLTNLKSLLLGTNQFTSPPSLSGLTLLESLDLSNNKLTTAPDLSELTGLTDIRLAQNQLTHPPIISGLVNLAFLDLRQNQIKDFSGLQPANPKLKLAPAWQRIALPNIVMGQKTSITLIDAQGGFAKVYPTTGQTYDDPSRELSCLVPGTFKSWAAMPGKPQPTGTPPTKIPTESPSAPLPASELAFTWYLTQTATVIAPVSRVAGASMFDTAVSLAKTGNYPTGGTVYIATSAGFPDALSGGAAAAAAHGAILLTEPNALAESTKAELLRLEPANIVIQGGQLAISQQVEDTIQALFPAATVSRNAGKTAVDTAISTSQNQFASAPAVFIATQNAYYDALGAGAAAGRNVAPILLIDSRQDTLPVDITAEIGRLGATTVYLLGGRFAVPQSIETALQQTPGLEVVRLSGPTLYDTAVETNKYTPHPIDTIYLTTSQAYSDGLAAGPAATQTNGAILLTNGKCLTRNTIDFIIEHKPKNIILVGGKAALPPALENLPLCA